MAKKLATFQDRDKRYQNLIERYAKLYGLTYFTHTLNVSRELFDYCKKGRTFVVIVLTDRKKQIYFRTALDKAITWELPGGFVEAADVSLEAAAARIVSRESGLQVDEIRPLAISLNEFHFGSESHVHSGLVYIAHVRTPKDQVSGDGFIGEFLASVPDRLIENDRKIARYAFDYIRTHQFNPPFNEIDESSNLGWRHSVHHSLIRPVQRVLSSGKLRRFVATQLIGQSIIDVSCGDDSLITSLASRNPSREFLANDIVWPLVRDLAAKARSSNIIFTNHDIVELPYKEQFDTVIFKNSLHHFQYEDAKSILLQLHKMTRRRLIVIDVENPRETKLSHYLWNQYYVRFLRDQGTDFWQQESFANLLSEIGPAEVGRLTTSRANYLTAIFTKE